MAKKLTAAQRTLIHPAIDMGEVPQHEPYVKPGPEVYKAAGGYPCAIHFFLPGSMRSLCGTLGLAPSTGRPEPTAGHGTCEACRVEASKMRAVVR